MYADAISCSAGGLSRTPSVQSLSMMVSTRALALWNPSSSAEADVSLSSTWACVMCSLKFAHVLSASAFLTHLRTSERSWRWEFIMMNPRFTICEGEYRTMLNCKSSMSLKIPSIGTRVSYFNVLTASSSVTSCAV